MLISQRNELRATLTVRSVFFVLAVCRGESGPDLRAVKTTEATGFRTQPTTRPPPFKALEALRTPLSDRVE